MGSDQRFSLRWNNYQSHLVTAFESLLDEKDFVDVTLGVEGRKLPAHKMLLSACSPYFREVLKGNPCQHPIIILRDIKFDDLFSLLQFMYNGEVNVAQDQLNSFLKSAESLKIRGLTDNESENSDRPPVSSQSRERVQENSLQPPPVKKKRPYPESNPTTHNPPSNSLQASAPQKPSHTTPIIPASVPTRPEPVKQEVIELGDEQYENSDQYSQEPSATDATYAQDHTNQSYDDSGAHAMVPAEEGGMEDIQGDSAQGYQRYTQSWHPDTYYHSEPYMTNEGSYGCPSCGKTFSSKRSWKNHNAVHDQGGDAGLSCSHCGKPQSSGTNYRRHLKTVHGIDNQ